MMININYYKSSKSIDSNFIPFSFDSAT